ncbi:MAG: sugar-binding transcriptional regulator [Pseudomonadales bacterium]|nr:sugar-binding transcriptional regulator [Pseudomonadales bacterium]NRA17925.1 sugar-binding transcriptional regulator [Oceanospirillaceae bacterium]
MNKMAFVSNLQAYETERQIHRVLVMHYIEGLKQSEIATLMNLSTARVNRLIKQGREKGMVEINIKSPFQPLLDVEEQLKKLSGVQMAMIAPTVSDNPDVVLQTVGEAAAGVLLENLKDGDIICITGGKGVGAVVDALNPSRKYDIEVVPATGCVQGKHYTDVNHVATQMAEKLGGRAYQIHAPLFAESIEQKDMLEGMRSVQDIMERARKATIAVVGVGSILVGDSSYYDLHPMAKGDQNEIVQSGAVGELLAHLLDEKGEVCSYELNSRLVAISPADLAKIPLTIGVASGENKVGPICAVLRGKHINALVVDETTANSVIEAL